MIEPTSGNKGGDLGTSSTIGDILNHPAFAGFGSLILPWDDRSYDESMPLSDIGLLLPYHSHVEPRVVVSALNRMIDDVNCGKIVFYDIHTETEKRGNPTLKNTGLFFFRGWPGAPFAIIAPGGGFSYVGSVHEGFPCAQEINKAGYNAFVLKYRVGHGATAPTRDMAAAISCIFRNAKTLGVSPRDYSLWGSSAGARMAAAIGSRGVASFGGDDLPKPSAVVMAYTGYSDSSLAAPPTFAVAGERDHIAPPPVMERRIAMLRNAGIKVEYHKYENVGHGFGLGIGTSAEGWVADAISFWEKAMTHGQ
jgi:acetyl esterase/lipase